MTNFRFEPEGNITDCVHRAYDLAFNLPQNSAFFAYELLAGTPTSLEAKARATVPYRVTCIQSPDRADEGTGGGCVRSSDCVNTTYAYTCPSGKAFTGSALHCVLYDNGECGGTASSGAPVTTAPVTWNVGASQGGGSVSGTAPSAGAEQMEGVICFPVCDQKEWFASGLKKFKETALNIIHRVGCSVNTASRDFNDESTDLAVKVPGGVIRVQRWFYQNGWHWEHLRQKLTFEQDSLSSHIRQITKGGVPYEAQPGSTTVFINDDNKIEKTADGYRWTDKNNGWKTFDSTGRMTAYGSRTGTVATLIYDGDRLSGIADRDGNQKIWFAYDADGLVESVSDGDNRTVAYAYTDGRLTTVTDVLDQDTTYQYNSAGQMTRKVDAAGRPTIITYDTYGNPASVADQDGQGHFFEFDYDSAKKESYARITTSAGRIKEVWYDHDFETKKVAVNGRVVQKIDKDGRNLIITDEKGRITRKEYDEWHNLTRIVNPDGTTVAFDYEHTFNRPVRITDPRGTITAFVYDADGNLTTKTEALGTDDERVTSFTYNDDGWMLTATVEADALTAEATTTFTYYPDGNVETVTDPEGGVSRFLEYDAMGGLKRLEDPRGHQWTFNYDDMGRLLSQSDPLGSTTAYAYDGANNRTAAINTYLKRFEFEYDDHNNMVKAIDPAGKYVQTAYNTDDLPVKMTDQEGRFSTTAYDSEGRITSATDGAGNATSYTYDESADTYASSRQPVRIDYPTYATTFTYDVMGRVVTETDILAEGNTQTRTYTYDEIGNVLAAIDEESRVTRFEYDALGRLVKTVDPLLNETLRTFDDRGNLRSVADAGGGITYYEYDRNNRLVKTIRPLLQETVFEYDAGGNRIAVIDAKGQRIEYDYDPRNLMTRVRYFAAGDLATPVNTVDFTYDDLGNLKTYGDGTTTGTYIYDDLSRKIAETVDYGTFTKTIGYDYYANGLKKSFTGADGEAVAYSYDEANRLSAITIPGIGQVTTNAYLWNAPAWVTLPGGSATDYTYDPLMRPKTLTSKDPAQNTVISRGYAYSPAGNMTAKEDIGVRPTH